MMASPPFSCNARRYDTGEPVRIDISAGRLERIAPLATCDIGEAEVATTAELPWLCPGFIDVQINGADGVEFSSVHLTVDRIRDIVEKVVAQGVTRFLPTVTTNAASVIEHGLRMLATAIHQTPFVARHVLGIHLEGPYISAEDGPRGAHPLAHCRRPDWQEFERFQEAADGRIRLVTLSPEYEESADFIRKAVTSGVVVAIGHTQATRSQILSAVDAGATLSTHLGNATHRVLPRHPNYLWDQLAEDRLMASFIVDGHHLSPEVVKSFIRAKQPHRSILISDLSGMAGLPPGFYRTELCELEIKADGRIVLAGQKQLLAGASRWILDGVANVMSFAGVDFRAAVEMATKNPARLLNAPCASFSVGETAEYVLLDRRSTGENREELSVRHVLCAEPS